MLDIRVSDEVRDRVTALSEVTLSLFLSWVNVRVMVRVSVKVRDRVTALSEVTLSLFLS